MNHIWINTDKLLCGMVIAESVHLPNGQVLLGKNTLITTRSILKLKLLSIPSVCITAESANPKLQETTLSYIEKVRNTEDFKHFNKNFEQGVHSIKHSLNEVVKRNAEIDVNKLIKDVEQVISQTPNKLYIFNMLHCMRDYDDLTYVHSFNVSLICSVFGHWLKMSAEDIRVLTLCGLLHDIGKLLIPQSIITKPSKLTSKEYEIVKKHTILGYDILKDKKIDNRIKEVALMHHEKCDGSGYPRGLVGEQISSFAKIVAVADVYDAMTSNRIYRQGLCPFEVISIFEDEGLSKYDPSYLLPFLESTVQSYIHQTVRLNNGQTGELIMINKLDLAHPVVHTNESFIDLSKNRHLKVEAIV
ncbi:transcriptional regulator [Sporanaerobium hydrogeniformans]|uniref:Transcriptional regulator n=1 Tax=Sporanaerobium hydrogeniformans TaxID=3072179 RepID=A0AC61DAI3_9FIRM|nr:HD-GYP domain-containing protein [Sporanaerobium hydrogeniformans]PHV70309.1 transcriptional regulator [Sporanaerobium hydrogeniformans]